MFRYRKSRKLKYNEQGLIYFMCHNYKMMPKDIQEKIEDTCIKACGDYWKAVFEYMTTNKTFVKICMEHYISESTLSESITKFYKSWFF